MASAIPENTARFSLGEVSEITSGTLFGDAALVVDGVTTDSRANTAGKLFIALPGERFDGHAFLTAAVRGGARAALVEKDEPQLRIPVIRVESTYAALSALARAHRRKWGGQLCAIAGSAGKTTTRSAVAAAFEAVAPGCVHFVAGNLNNRVGVPAVLLGLQPAHRYAVIEIGTNAPGEVSELARIAEPDIAVVTVIGLEHTEGLGSLDQIEAEEGSVFAALPQTGAAIGNSDDVRVARQLANASSQRRIGYGFGPAATYRIRRRTVISETRSRLLLERPERGELRVDYALLGNAGAYAVAAAVAAAEAASNTTVQASALEAAFRRVGSAEPGRLTPVELANRTLVLDDSYNSNPASLQSSVATAEELARLRGGRLVLVLGEMRELGDESPRLHREAAESIGHTETARVVAFSGDARWLLEPFARRGVPTLFVQDAEAAARALEGELRQLDVVLVKASRSVRAERVVAALIARHGRAS